ncbi:MAG: membrane protein insertase YidC [Pseudomonadota bacterium]
MENGKNLLLTIVLSVGVLLLWQVFFINPRLEAERQAQIEQAELQTSTEEGLPAAAVSGDAGIPQAVAGDGIASLDTEAAISTGARVAIETETLSGSINLAGARIDDLSLKQYRQENEDGSPIVELLKPTGGTNAYFAEFGYAGFEGAPAAEAVWTAPAGATLTATTPVTLSYTAGDLTFERTISVDDRYMFTFADTVTNGGVGATSLQNYGRVTRYFKPAVPSIFILHEGMIGVTGEEGLQEHSFGDMEDEPRITPGKSNDGWVGITDKYWAAALIPEQGTTFQPRYAYFDQGAVRWQSDFLADPIVINAGQSATVTNRLFAGAKVSSMIDDYEADLGIRSFELLIDWGWLYFITKPMFQVLDWLFKLVGNFGVAILLLTVAVKAVFFPLANKSYASMARMKVVQPQMQEIKERHGDDREKLQKAMMELYKKEKINPIAGCWPILIQIPVFFALYKVLFVTIEMRHAPFFGWIQDLSAPDPTSIWELFGLIPWGAAEILPAFLLLGIWPIVMGITMFVQMQMNPAPPDPTQQMIFRWMPVIFTFMLATFPAGLVIYWAWNNFLSILQQGVIMKKNGADIALWDNIRGMFSKKAKDGGT